MFEVRIFVFILRALFHKKVSLRLLLRPISVRYSTIPLQRRTKGIVNLAKKERKTAMAEVTKGMQSLMTETRKFPPPQQLQKNAWIKSMDDYQKMCSGWNRPKSLHWFKEPTKEPRIHLEHEGPQDQAHLVCRRQLNVSYNCLDRHLGTPIAKQDGHHLAGRSGRRRQKIHLQRTAHRSLQVRQRAEVQRASKRATAWRSICRWCRNWRL
jgi:hypothetical protein